MRLPRTISMQHMGSVAAFLIAGSMVSFALGQQIGHATHVPRQTASHQSRAAGALGARVAVQAPQPAPVAQKAPATQPAVALVRTAPAATHADNHHDDEHHGGDGHQGGHGDKHGSGGGDGHQGGGGGGD